MNTNNTNNKKLVELNELLEKYNDNVFDHPSIINNINNINPNPTLPITGGALNTLIPDEFVNPINNSFFSNDPKENLLDKFLNSNTQIKHLIIGGGPNGLYLGYTLSYSFPNHIIIVVDSRIEVEHKRKPFSRKRIIATQMSQPINEIELEYYNRIKDAVNVKFLYTKESMINIINNSYNNIKFVYDTTGGRLNELLNPLSDIIKIGTNITITKKDDDKYIYNNNLTKETFICNSKERFIVGKQETVMSITQDDKSIDYWINGEVSDEFINKNINKNFNTINDLKNYINTKIVLNDNGYLIINYDTMDNNNFINFKQDKPVILTMFNTQFKISRHKPCAIHFNDSSKFVKFDLGESLFSLLIISGNNITTSRYIIDHKLILLLQNIQKYFLPIIKNQNKICKMIPLKDGSYLKSRYKTNKYKYKTKYNKKTKKIYKIKSKTKN